MLFAKKRVNRSNRSALRAANILGYGFLMVLMVAILVGWRASSGPGLNVPTTELRRGEALSPSRFVPGQRLIYKVAYATASATDFRPLFAEEKDTGSKGEEARPELAQSFKTTVQGELTATVLSQNEETAVIAYRLRQPEVSLIVNGQEAVDQSAQIKTDLSQETFASVNLHGNVVSVRFDPGVGGLSQSFARALLAITQFVVPSSRTAGLDQWQTRESDPGGEYVAHYTEMAEPPNSVADIVPGQKSFSKTKTRYIQAQQVTSSDEVEATTEIRPKGSMVAKFDFQRGYLLSLNGTESQTISIGGKPVATAECTLRMTEVRQEILSPEELASIRDLNTASQRVAAAVPLFAPPSREATEASIERTELGDSTLDALLADLAKVESAAGNANETPIYLKFKAMIYLHPESCAHIGRILTTADANGPTMRILTGALSTISHPEAQAAMVTAMRARPEDWPALSLLMPALGQSPSPTETSEELLHELAFNSHNPDIASTAQLSLGSMARNLAQIAPERTAKIVKVFINAIERAPSAGATRLMILALGNAGSSDAFPIISRFLHDRSPELRAAASEALRWVDSDQVEPLLINALICDQDPSVRQEAAIALGFRNVGDASFRAQKGVFLKETDVKTRLAVLNNLWKAKDSFPEVRGIVKEAANRNSSKEVRKAAGEIMAMYP